MDLNDEPPDDVVYVNTLDTTVVAEARFHVRDQLTVCPRKS